MSNENVVAGVIAFLKEKGVSMSGPCGAFAIVQRVAWALRGEGFGLLYKGGGENCQGYDTSSVMKPNGEHWDILEDAGGKNGPQWNRVVYTDDRPVEGHATGDPYLRPEMYRPAMDPGDGVVKPPVDPQEPTPNEPEPPSENVPAALQAFMNAVADSLGGLTVAVAESAIREAKLMELVANLKAPKAPKYVLTVNIPFVGKQTITAEPTE